MESGTKLGHYEIGTLLGKGGMGEVWRARDTKLGREVAIKTLPEEFANDSDRLARFEREAKLLASLNHPNIAAFHGFEEDMREVRAPRNTGGEWTVARSGETALKTGSACPLQFDADPGRWSICRNLATSSRPRVGPDWYG